MKERNVSVPRDKRLEFRIGINVGDVIIEDNDIFGHGVNVAARLEGIAEPGGIVISAIAHDAVSNRIEAEFRDLGGLSLKNIERPGAERFRSATGWKTALSTLSKTRPNSSAPSFAVISKSAAWLGSRPGKAGQFLVADGAKPCEEVVRLLELRVNPSPRRSLRSGARVSERRFCPIGPRLLHVASVPQPSRCRSRPSKRCGGRLRGRSSWCAKSTPAKSAGSVTEIADALRKAQDFISEVSGPPETEDEQRRRASTFHALNQRAGSRKRRASSRTSRRRPKGRRGRARRAALRRGDEERRVGCAGSRGGIGAQRPRGPDPIREPPNCRMLQV